MHSVASAQDEPSMEVTSFKAVPTDLDARVNSPLTDWNGNVCALIKIQTVKKGFSFDTGTIAITKVIQKKGEIWVYVSPGIRKLNIYHEDYGVCRYEIPVPVEKASVYLLKLKVYGGAQAKPDSIKPPTNLNVGSIITENGDRLMSLNDEFLSMVKVEGGTFIMGEGASGIESTPFHQVTLSEYYISRYEVTERLWTTLMGGTSMAQTPAKRTFEEWEHFIEVLNKTFEYSCRKDRLEFRMPTEAEWEFAARGGNLSRAYRYSGSDNLNDVAWTVKNSPKKVREVGMKTPNELGLYDMTGNVWEVCSDWWGVYGGKPQTDPKGPFDGSMHVVRGGDVSIVNSSWFLNVGRACAKPETAVGLRIVLSKY